MTRVAAALLTALIWTGGSHAGDGRREAVPSPGADTGINYIQLAAEDHTRTRSPLPAGCFRGRLTGEGDTCQAMRTESGALITLGGPLRGFRDGDSVCVCGVRAQEPFCRQGVTVLIREIAAICADIR